MRRLLASAIILALPACAQEQVDPNYAAILSVSLQINQAQQNTQTARAEAMANSIASCAKFTGELAQVMCAGFVTGRIGGSGMDNSSTPVALPLPPKVEREPTWYEALLNAPAKTLNALSQWVPGIVQYALGKVQAQSSERIQIAQSGERAGLYTVFGQQNAQAMAAIRDVASQGFITIGAIPQGPVSNSTYSGTFTGVGFGAGSVNYNPISNSYNPITNPAARVCTVTAGVLTCGG